MAGAGGLAEGVYRSLHQVVTHRPASMYYWELLWMAPLSAAGAGAIVGVCLAAGAWILRGLPAKSTTVLLGFLAIYPVMQSEGIPLHWSVEALLSIALAKFVTDVLGARMKALDTRLLAFRKWLVGSVALLTLVGVLDHALSNERLALATRDAAPAGLPNILLIILDTVRAADLSLYGYGRSTTPWLSEWSGTGVVFERAYATTSWTLPSHASIFTGRYPHVLSTGFSSPLDSRYPTLAEVLGAHGYVTVGFAANTSYASRMSGLQRGFDRYEAIPIDLAQLWKSSWLSMGMIRHTPGLPSLFRLRRRTAEDIAGAFLTWEAGQSDRPYFAFLNLFDAHAPYEAPEDYRTLFGPDPASTWEYMFNTWGLHPDTIYDTSRLTRWRGRYDGAIRYVDDQLRAMFAELEARGVLNNTLVIVTADHGEMWGEKGQVDHATSLYLPLLHVPLVISYPGRMPAGRRLDTSVTLRDLPSTILDLAGLGPDTLIPGRSLRAYWDDAAESRPSEPLRSDLGLYPEEVAGWAPGVVNWAPGVHGPMTSFIQDSLQYILRGDGVEELYDIWGDPNETEDLSAKPESQSDLARFRSLTDSVR